jgi:hypothetical protein
VSECVCLYVCERERERERERDQYFLPHSIGTYQFCKIKTENDLVQSND